MKTVFRVVSLSILLFSAGRIIAQQPITLNSTDMPVVGWTQRTVKDTLPLPPINFGNKGANQVYNFGSLQGIVYDTVMYKALTSQQSSVFTGADLAITADDINFLFTKTTTAKTDLRGFEGKLVPNGNVIQVPFSTPSDLFHFPTTYNTRFSGTSALNKTVPGSDVGQPSVYEVRFTVNSTYQDTVDGWGKVITPVGSYKGLRKKRVETTTTHIEYRLCGTIICPWTTLSNTTTTTTRYTYPVLEAKGSVLTFDYDSANNVTGVTYSLIPPLAPVADFNYAAGAGGMVTFTDATDGYPDTYFWDFGDGSTSNAPNPTHTYTANGTYNVCLTVTNAGGSDTYCESVQVTGICPTILPNVTTNDAACGVADGSATVAPSGGANPYSFLWSNNQTTATINNLAAGSYTVTITVALWWLLPM
jgi:PKD repeat protein